MIVAAPYIQLFDFLEPDEVASLNRRVADRRDQFHASTVYTPEHGVDARHDDIRRSRVDHDAGDVLPVFEDRLRALLPHLRRELGVPHFALGDIEIQLTVHGAGDFFAPHADEDQVDTDRARAVTFVYYFNAGPRAFEGGTLRLFDDEVVDGGRAPADSATELEPVHNSIVFFPADRLHEVTPVRADGEEPGSLRCSVNGWFHQGDRGNPRRVDLSPSTLRLLQPRLLPRLTEPGVVMRPIPRPDHLRLAAHWARHRGDAELEPVGSVEAGADAGPRVLPLGHMGQEMLERLRPIHEEFAGRPLVPVSCSGIRNHGRGQTLSLHVDRCEEHVISSVLHLDRHLDRPWPFRIECGGTSHDLDLAPGQMVIYEGAACPHGWPDPLAGAGYVSLVLHYRPVEWAHRTHSLAQRGRELELLDVEGRPTDRLTAPPAAGALVGI